MYSTWPIIHFPSLPFPFLSFPIHSGIGYVRGQDIHIDITLDLFSCPQPSQCLLLLPWSISSKLIQ